MVELPKHNDKQQYKIIVSEIQTKHELPEGILK